MRKTTLLKKLVHAPEILVIPGVPDPLCARIAQKAGFKAVFVSGYAASAATLGARSGPGLIICHGENGRRGARVPVGTIPQEKLANSRELC